MKKISWVILMMLMTACFPKEAQREHHQRHIDDSSTVKIKSSTSKTSSSISENTTVLSTRTEFLGFKNEDITVLPTRTETSDKVTITDFWKAIEEGNYRVAGELIKNPEIKKHINTQNENGETALSLAGNDIWFSISLLKAGANPTFPNGDTILMKFAEQNLPVDLFLEIPSVRDVINAQNEKGESALFLAAKGTGGEIFVGNIQDLLSAGADPTLPDKTERTVLSMIYEKVLLATKNTDRMARDNQVHRKFYDVTPFTSILEDLLKVGADPNLPDGDTILMKYILLGVSVNSLLKIPSIKEMINTRNEDGETAFSLAAKEKYWEVMAELVRHNADARSLCMPDNIPDNISKEEMYVKRNNFADALKRPKYNILMICSLSGQADGVKKLLENPNVHTNINLSNISRETAFSLATEENRWEVMAELARNDADTGSLNAPDNSLCAPHNIPDNISEAELFVNTNKPYNILMICSLSGRTDSVRKLLENSNVRVHINAQNENGETAFSLVAKEILFPKTFLLGDRPIKFKRMLLFAVMRDLLSFGADPSLLPEEHFQEIQQTIATVTEDANFGDTFLMFLIRKNELDSIEKLLEIPAVRENINSQNKDGETAFFLAKRKQYTQIMELLLKTGADTDIVPPVSGK